VKKYILNSETSQNIKDTISEAMNIYFDHYFMLEENSPCYECLVKAACRKSLASLDSCSSLKNYLYKILVGK